MLALSEASRAGYPRTCGHVSIRRSSEEIPRGYPKGVLDGLGPHRVSQIGEAQDEYDGYVGSVYKLLIQRSPVSKIFDYLWWLETEQMGLAGDRPTTQRFAERLARLPDEIES